MQVDRLCYCGSLLLWFNHFSSNFNKFQIFFLVFHWNFNPLCHYGIRGLANKWLESYLANRKQFVSINNFESSTSGISCGVPQGSVFGPLLFLIYINDLHVVIKRCKVHHFADDTNLLIINKSLKRLSKLLNIDLKNLPNWLNANKIWLNVSKTELIIFKPKRKLLAFNMKI